MDIRDYFPEAYHRSVVVTTRSSKVTIGHRMQIRKLDSDHDSFEILAKISGREEIIKGKAG